MVEKWYRPLIEKIKEVDEECVFVQDDHGFFDSNELEKEIKKYFCKIHQYSSEMKLRMVIRNTKGNLLVVFQEGNYLPNIMMKKYPVIELSYNDIFPLLESGAMDWLNTAEIQELYYLYTNNLNQYDSLSYLDTLDFILKNLYETDIEFTGKEQLIGFLIRYYFVNDRLKGAIKSWVFKKIDSTDVNINNIGKKNNFFDWLSQEWKNYLSTGRSTINFNDRKVKFLLNDCFEQGLMEPVDLLAEEFDSDFIIRETKANYWINSGVKNLDKVSVKENFQSEYRLLQEILNEDLKPHEWGNVARKWGHLVYLKHLHEIEQSLSNLEIQIDNKFTDFMVNNYDDLAYDQRFYYAPLNNRILPEITGQNKKFVLICFDGISFKEWPAVKDYLNSSLSVNFKEGISFSMIPTVTSISRRAIFGGILPVEDDGSGNEKKLFKNYLKQKCGLQKEEIYFNRSKKPEELDLLGYESAGLIFNFIDDLSHGAMNQKMLIKNIKDQLEESQLDKLIKYCLENEYRVYFCSDHGNIFCEGNGYNPHRQLVEDKAARAVLYGTRNLAENEELNNKLILQFPNILGEQYIVTMRDRTKFSNRDSGFTHGGINIEEVIVPFVEVIK